jgi:copper chaperone CopZ
MAHDNLFIDGYDVDNNSCDLSNWRKKMNEQDNCYVEPLEKHLDEEPLSKATVAYLAVGGMGCPSCAMRVRNGLLGLDGVLLVEVQLERGIAAAAFDQNKINSNDLLRAVASAGNDGRHNYSAQLIQQIPAEVAIPWL